MQVDFLFQNNNQNTLEDEFKKAFSNDVKKVYLFCGELKDTGFKIIEEELIDTKIKSFFVIGIDKKNTTRVMLEDMLDYTDDVYYYSNNLVNEYYSNMMIFEYAKSAVIYVSSVKLSDTCIKDDLSLYTKITYDTESDMKEYKSKLKDILKITQDDKFTKLDKEKIEELVVNKEIFTTRQYVHTVRSISELLGNTKETKEEDSQKNNEVDDDILETSNVPKVELSDIDIDIDFGDISDDIAVNDVQEEKSNKDEVLESDLEDEFEFDENIKTEFDEINNFNSYEDDIQGSDSLEVDLDDVEEDGFDFDSNGALDINSLLFSKANMRLNLDNIEKNDDVKEEKNLSKDDEIVKVKKLNLNNITNFIFEVPSKTSKGQDVNAIKIPNYIQTMIPKFFELVDNSKSIQINDANYKVRDIELEIVDVKNNQKYVDRNARISYKSGQSYLTFNSELLKSISYEEYDIARVIKLSPNVYHIEIITKDIQEYKLWSKLCNQTFKSTDRKYGMM